jgi:hypothetical protein
MRVFRWPCIGSSSSIVVVKEATANEIKGMESKRVSSLDGIKGGTCRLSYLCMKHSCVCDELLISEFLKYLFFVEYNDIM